MRKSTDMVQISAEEAQKVLKDLVFSMWADDGCEERTDTLKMLTLVDFFLPFLPLERPHIEALFAMRLRERRRTLIVEGHVANLTWTPDVVTFLTDRVRSCRQIMGSLFLLDSIHYCMCMSEHITSIHHR